LFWEFDIWLVFPSDTIGPRPLLLFRLEALRYVEEAKNSTRLEVEAPTVQRERNIFQKYKIIHLGNCEVFKKIPEATNLQSDQFESGI
jgi:hypothetical protein